MFEINGRAIGDNFPPIVIAEIGINHEGSIDVAIEMADSAIDAGAELIKHQTHIVDDEMSQEAKFAIPGNADLSIYDIIKRCALSEGDEYKLMQHIQSRGATFISTPFSREAVYRLARFNVPAFKIGSGECSNYPLVRLVAKIGKPVILSTGMNDLESIKPSVNILREYGVPFALLHCTNVYPTPNRLVRLDAIKEIKYEFPDAVVGLSDHTTTNYACLGAVALGARILERHFTDSYSRPGPDIVCSMDPPALAELIEGSKIIFESVGGGKAAVKEEEVTMAFAFSSVVVVDDLYPGDVLTEENLWVRRPAGGDFNANDYDRLIGKVLAKPILKNQRLTKSHICEK